MMKNVLKDQEGAVLVLVLIVLVAAIIMGVMIIRTSSLEAKMAGNEQRYLNSFANIESAANYILLQNTAALEALSSSVGAVYVTSSGLPAGTSVSVSFDRQGSPPKGSGYDMNQQARYYSITATDSADNQRVTVGAYRVLPKNNVF
jgi:hypothetical protein